MDVHEFFSQTEEVVRSITYCFLCWYYSALSRRHPLKISGVTTRHKMFEGIFVTLRHSPYYILYSTIIGGGGSMKMAHALLKVLRLQMGITSRRGGANSQNA